MLQSQKRQMDNNAEESGDEDVQRRRLELMKEHVEQKMAVLQGRKMDWDTELESVSDYFSPFKEVYSPERSFHVLFSFFF